MKYKAVFFDLDHTLWDYESNSADTLKELYLGFNLKDRGVAGFENFLNRFNEVNRELWHLYDHGKIDSTVIRKERFRKILSAFEIDDEPLAQNLSTQYITESPKKGKLVPDAVEVLNYLSRHYTLSVITNGFEDIQHTKLASGRLTTYFHHIVTSEKAGCKKPARGIFDFALSANKIQAHEAVMIGDNPLTDIAGARNASVDAIFYNPARIAHQEEVKHEIASLKELCSLL